MKIAVSGASGFVGTHLCRHLVNQGHEVIALTRSGEAPQGTTGVRADVVTAEGLAEAFAAADAVMHLVGIISEKGEQVSFEKVHVRGTENVLQAAQAVEVKRYVHMSALGARRGTPSQYFETKAAAEELVRASTIASTIIRPSLIFGLGDDFFGKVLKDLVTAAPLIPQIGDGHFPFRPIWVGDVASAFEQALAKPETIGESYDLVGPQEYSLKALLELMRQTLKLSKPIFPVPLALMKLAVPMMQILPQPPISQDQFAMLLEGNTGNPEKMMQAFDLSMTRLEAVLPSILAAQQR